MEPNLVRPGTEYRRAAKKLALAGAVAGVLSSPASAQPLGTGVNFTNADRLSVAARDTNLDQMKAAGVKVIRTPLAQQWGAGSFQPSVEVVRAAWSRGIKSLLVISLTAPKYFPAGTSKRPADPAAPSIWAAYRLQDVDPDLFAAAVAPLLQQLDDMGVALAGIELFNEIGNPAFNGDIAISGPRGGYLIGFEDLLDPAYADVARGYRNYIRVLAALKGDPRRSGCEQDDTHYQRRPEHSGRRSGGNQTQRHGRRGFAQGRADLPTRQRSRRLCGPVRRSRLYSVGREQREQHPPPKLSAHYGQLHQARRRNGVGHASRGRLPSQRCGPPDPVQSPAG